MLLTQSQVSIFLSAVTIFLCTLALFLSGYVLQQRTLNNLRAAIRPQQPLAQLYIPSSHDAPSPLPESKSNSNSDNAPTTIEVFTSQSNPQERITIEPLPNPKSPEPKTYKDLLVSYLDATANRQDSRPPTWQRGAGILNTVNKLIHRWIARVRGIEAHEAGAGAAEEDDESIPLEKLSRAARRRRIKMDIRKLGSGEDVDMSKIYRPRKRAW